MVVVVAVLVERTRELKKRKNARRVTEKWKVKKNHHS